MKADCIHSRSRGQLACSSVLMATHTWIALQSISGAISKSIFKPVSTRKNVFWSLHYLLSWHLNIQIVLHCGWHVLFLSLSYFMHICFISQLDCIIFAFRWCATFSFIPLFIWSRKFVYPISFCGNK